MARANAEVIDLDSDDDTSAEKEKKKTKSCNVNCINFRCQSHDVETFEAPAFACFYYGVTYKNKNNKIKHRRICEPCFEVAMKHQEVCKQRFFHFGFFVFISFLFCFVFQ